MTFGHTDNKTSRDINGARYKARLRGPSEKQNHLWHKEFLESGAQFRMSYSAFRKGKLKQFNKQRYLRSLKKKKQ